MLAATPAGGEPTDFAEIVSRARAYVVEYEHALSEVRAEERYVQQVVDADGRVVETLALVSEFMVFQLPPAEDWFAFREVIEMDGQPRHDPDLGFDELRLAPSSDVVSRAREMSAASARHNLGDLVRTINLPTFALAFLRPVNRDHVRFDNLGAEVVEGRHTCVIGYVEVGRPTLIATPGGDDLVTRGRFWVVPADGRIVRSELITGDARSGWIGAITVTYRPSTALGIWYIAEMAELYTRWPNGERVTATATYSKLRRAEEQQLARLRPPLDPLPAEPVLLPAAADVRPPDLPAAVLAPRSERHVGMLVGGLLGLGLGPHRLLVGGHLEAASRVAGLSTRRRMGCRRRPFCGGAQRRAEISLATEARPVGTLSRSGTCLGQDPAGWHVGDRPLLESASRVRPSEWRLSGIHDPPDGGGFQGGRGVLAPAQAAAGIRAQTLVS